MKTVDKATRNKIIRSPHERMRTLRSLSVPEQYAVFSELSPYVQQTIFQKLKTRHPNMPYYTLSEDQIKVPAGWLVEKCGFKGKRFGDAGVHKNQALVLVNYKNAKGKDILALAKAIQKTVSQEFEIDLEMEVNII